MKTEHFAKPTLTVGDTREERKYTGHIANFSSLEVGYIVPFIKRV